VQNDKGTLPPASARELAALVDYQDGAVVSRTLIDKKAGTVTLFAFGRGQALSEHTAPFDALIYVVDGDAEITIEGEAHRLGRGELIVMPAAKPHAVRAIGKFKMLLVMIRE
jgi:quercetin dioxygenase-like cupin family protein